VTAVTDAPEHGWQNRQSMATVLFVDDGTYGSRKLIRILQKAGHTVCQTTGEDALGVFSTHSIDIVVMDCHLCRRINSVEGLAAVARRLRPGTPVIMLSSYCGVPCPQSQQADACLQKGTSGRNFLETLEMMLRARGYGLCRSVAA
jgi:CheY-like chemotaxis protein